MDFLSGFGKRFSNAARSASEKNRESAEQARINDELREASAELDKLFAAYGRACYVLRLGEGDRAAADDLVVRIRAAHARVDALTARRDEWREPVRCAACGALQPRGARYCNSCGKRISAQEAQPEPLPDAGRYCPKCGASCGEEEAVCAVCGAMLDDSAGEPAPVFEPDAALLAQIDVEEPADGGEE